MSKILTQNEINAMNTILTNVGNLIVVANS